MDAKKLKIDEELAAAKVDVERTVKEWMTNKRASLAKDVTTFLNARHEDIICSLLGFRKDYGRWEIDNYNGRTSETTVAFREAHKPIIQEWLSQITEMPKFTAKELEDLKKEYKNSVLYALRHEAAAKGKEQAAILVNEMLEEALQLEKAQEDLAKSKQLRVEAEQERLAAVVRQTEARVRAEVRREMEEEFRKREEIKRDELTRNEDHGQRPLEPEL